MSMSDKTSLLTKTVMSIVYESLDKNEVCDDTVSKIDEFVEQLLSEVNNFSLRISNKKMKQQKYNPKNNAYNIGYVESK